MLKVTDAQIQEYAEAYINYGHSWKEAPGTPPPAHHIHHWKSIFDNVDVATFLKKLELLKAGGLFAKKIESVKPKRIVNA